MWLVVLVHLIIQEILMWSVNLNVKSTMIVLILRPVCPRNAGILVQDLVEQVQIVEWCLTIQFVAVPPDTQETPWNLAEFHPLLNQ
jgi:hypothetical protein